MINFPQLTVSHNDYMSMQGTLLNKEKMLKRQKVFKVYMHRMMLIGGVIWERIIEKLK